MLAIFLDFVLLKGYTIQHSAAPYHLENKDWVTEIVLVRHEADGPEVTPSSSLSIIVAHRCSPIFVSQPKRQHMQVPWLLSLHPAIFAAPAPARPSLTPRPLPLPLVPSLGRVSL